MTHIATPRNWFTLTYTEHAPPGLPPMLEADRVVRYRDETGTWLVALWEATDPHKPANCILRVREEHIDTLVKHTTFTGAVGAYTPN